VTIDASNLLGGTLATNAFKVGNIVAEDVDVVLASPGTGDAEFGTIAATGNLKFDVSGFSGKVAAADNNAANLVVGAITAGSAEIKGAVFANAFTVTTDSLIYTGGHGVDALTVTGNGGTAMNVKAGTGIDNDTVAITAVAATTSIVADLDTGIGNDTVSITGGVATTGISFAANSTLGAGNDSVTVNGSANLTTAMAIDLSNLAGYETSTITGRNITSLAFGAIGGADTLIAGGGEDRFNVSHVSTALSTNAGVRTTVIQGFDKDDDTVSFGYAAAAATGTNCKIGTEFTTLAALLTAAIDSTDGLGDTSMRYYVGELSGGTLTDAEKGLYLISAATVGTGATGNYNAVVQLHGLTLADYADAMIVA
jgi:hypothetical protein